MYKTQPLTGNFFKIFSGVYNDFCQNSATDYKFEIPPLDYKGFIEYFEKGLIQCIVLLEDEIPTGFLAYSFAENLAIELFIIHLLGEDDLENKAEALTKEFLDLTSDLRTTRLVSYPMLGKQEKYKEKLEKLGFKFLNLGVMVFDPNDRQIQKELQNMPSMGLPIGFKIVSYADMYFEDLAEAINLSFENSSDVNYDERFKTIEGSRDVAEKITNSFYGKFISSASKVLLFENKLAGFCLANITADTIGNIPLVGILPEYRGQGLSKVMLKMVLEDIIKSVKSGFLKLSEVNASVDLDNESAVKMYKGLGFKESHSYPQGYFEKEYPGAM